MFVRSVLGEWDYWVRDECVTGTIPPELVGTYFRNGAGMHAEGRHPFDGDGMVLSIAFRDGKAFFRNRFVKTDGFLEEQAAGRPTQRNAFSRGSPGGGLFNPLDFKFKNIANTGVLPWAGKLFALWEAGLPHELNPRTLETIGKTDLGGQLTSSVLAAHYRVMTQADGSRRWCTFGSNATATGATVTFYEFDEAGKQVATRVTEVKAELAMLHDFAVTDSYYVLVTGSTRMNVGRFMTSYLFGRSAIAECIEFAPDVAAKVILIPRDPSKPAITAACPDPFFPFHHVNAFDEPSGSGRVVVDTVAWQELDLAVNIHNMTPAYYEGGMRTDLVRLVVDPASGSVTRASRIIDAQTVEFPSVAPSVTGRPHTHMYMVGDKVQHEVFWGPLQALIKVSMAPGTESTGTPAKVERWIPGPRTFLQEPMFVPRPGGTTEDDGWIILTSMDAARAGNGEVYILDAQNVAAGPVAMLRLPHNLPTGLHGSFTPEYLGPEPGDVPEWREVAKYRQI
ncbi:hypothetical protein FOA52_014880 [Chlamydomonas sp. UWO 241]|nr:hypothetical protein FOA52_014880 [Chlamydomonas sp. UWO 241]